MFLGVWGTHPTCIAKCPEINVVASTTTAGASCAGGSVSDYPICDFHCEAGYEIDGDEYASTIMCHDGG